MARRWRSNARTYSISIRTPAESRLSCWFTTRISSETPWKTNTLKVRRGSRSGIFHSRAAPAGAARGPRTRGGAGFTAQLAAQLRRRTGRNGTEAGFDGREVGLRSAHMGFERLAHDAQVIGRGAATAADDPSARIQRKPRVLRHQLGSSVEADLAVAKLRNRSE